MDLPGRDYFAAINMGYFDILVSSTYAESLNEQKVKSMGEIEAYRAMLSPEHRSKYTNSLTQTLQELIDPIVAECDKLIDSNARAWEIQSCKHRSLKEIQRFVTRYPEEPAAYVPSLHASTRIVLFLHELGIIDHLKERYAADKISNETIAKILLELRNISDEQRSISNDIGKVRVATSNGGKPSMAVKALMLNLGLSIKTLE